MAPNDQIIKIITTTSLPAICLYSASAGILSHLTYFIRGEHHNNAFGLFKLVVFTPVALALAQYLLTDLGLGLSAIRSIASMASYLTGLWTSMIVYRIFFHPLRHFPGPLGAKVSKFWHAKETLDLKNFQFLEKLHEQYGDYVRTGPNEISIFSPAGPVAVNGPRTKCTKGPWSDRTLPALSLQSVRDKQVHDRRRRIWDYGFSASSLRAYEGRVVGLAQVLEQQLHARAGQVIDATKWFHLYGFDVMTDIAFGRSFNMTKTGEMHFALEKLRDSMRETGQLAALPWLFILLKNLPLGASGIVWFIKWCQEQMMLRVEMDKEVEVKDVTSWLVEAYQKSDPSKLQEELQWLCGDARLLIIAGSDTTSSVMTYTAYELAKHPQHMQKLREELSIIPMNSDGTYDVRTLATLEHLNAVINEVLRLHPPVPSGLSRLTPDEGLTIDNTFIPGGTTVLASTYSIQRSSAAFEKPKDFIPERWSSQPELIKDKSAYAPFNIGTYSCIGKQLALMELRVVTTMIVKNFNIEFPTGQDGSDFVNNALDTFTLTTADLNVVFVPVK